MKLIFVFTLLCHFVFISGEVSFKCEKFDHFDDNPFSCLFNSQFSPREFDDYLTNLTVLSFKYQDEKNVTRESLIDLKEITKIAIENVEFQEFPAKIFEKFPFLKNLKITADIKNLKSSDFINATRLEELDLSDNLISTLDSEQFKHLASIKSITLAYNTLKTVDKSNFIGIGSNLTHIDLSNNHLKSFSEDFIAAMITNQELITINLSFNNMSDFSASINDFSSNSTEVVLILAFNNISEIQIKNKLHGINVKNNRLKFFEVTAATVIAENNELDSFFIGENCEVMTLDNNRITSLKWDKSLEKLLELDLSDNGMLLTEIKDLFSAMPNLRILDLSNNKIDSLNLEEALDSVRKLKHLSLKNIGIKKISENTFEKLLDLETLIISHNPIFHIDLTFFKNLKNLEILQVDSTYINTIGDFKEIKEILPNLLRISIDGNVIPCRELKEMFEFFEPLGIEIIDPQNLENYRLNIKGIKCTDPSHELEPIVNGRDADEITYKFEEMMAHIKAVEERQKQGQTGITMTQLIFSNCISIALSFSILLAALCIANHLKNNRYKKFIDSLDIENQVNGL